MCLSERSDPRYAERVRLVEKYRQESLGYMFDEKRLKANYNAIRNTYKPEQPYQHMTISSLNSLAKFYMLKGDFRRAAETFMMSYYAIKDIHFFTGYIALFAIARTYLRAGLLNEFKKTCQLAKSYFVGHVEIFNYVFDFNE